MQAQHQVPPTIFELAEILGDKKIADAIRANIPPWHPRCDGEEGASGEGGSGEGSGASGSGEGSGSGSGTSSPPKNEENKGGSGSGSGDDGDTVQMTRDEAQRLRRLAREADDLKKKQKEEKDAAERKKKQEEGRWQELVNEEQEKTRAAERERDESKQELVKFKFQIKVNEIANRIGFEDPSDAHLYLGEEHLESTDKVLEGALSKILSAKPHLKSKRKATGGNGGGAGGTGDAGLTMDQIKAMSPDEINANWAQVQKVMAASKQ